MTGVRTGRVPGNEKKERKERKEKKRKGLHYADSMYGFTLLGRRRV